MTDRLVILTGAGISADSGLPVFRGPGGLWEGRRAEELATPEAFRREPGLVHRFYNQRRAALAVAVPNAAHFALARLQREYPGEVVLVTQNVDDLHERAGSSGVLHLHGELRRARCTRCGGAGIWDGDLGTADICPACGRSGGMRPDIVWFGEVPCHLDHIARMLSGAALFAAIGTSGHVYPAAGFVAAAREAGVRTIELNAASTRVSSQFHEHRTGPASETVPTWVDELLRAG